VSKVELERIVGRLSITLNEFFKDTPKHYKDYDAIIKSIIPKEWKIKMSAKFFIFQRAEFSFGKVYMYAQADYIFTNDKVIAVRHGGWRIDSHNTSVIIMTDYHIDVLDKDIAERELSLHTKTIR